MSTASHRGQVLVPVLASGLESLDVFVEQTVKPAALTRTNKAEHEWKQESKYGSEK